MDGAYVNNDYADHGGSNDENGDDRNDVYGDDDIGNDNDDDNYDMVILVMIFDCLMFKIKAEKFQFKSPLEAGDSPGT